MASTRLNMAVWATAVFLLQALLQCILTASSTNAWGTAKISPKVFIIGMVRLFIVSMTLANDFTLPSSQTKAKLGSISPNSIFSRKTLPYPASLRCFHKPTAPMTDRFALL